MESDDGANYWVINNQLFIFHIKQLDPSLKQQINFYVVKNWDSDGGEDSYCGLLGYDTM
jgi:hypothetical protein